MADISQITIPVKNPSTGVVTNQTFGIKGSAPSNVYSTDDAAETELADGDYIPFYDTSATAKRKTLWSNIIAKIKAALGTAAVKDYTTSVTSGSADLVTSGAVKTELDKKFGDFTSVSDVNIGGANLHVYWKNTPTSSGTYYGYAVNPGSGMLERVTCKNGVYSRQDVEQDSTTGDIIKMNAAQSGTVQSSVTTTLAASTTMDSAIGTLLNNDATLKTTKFGDFESASNVTISGVTYHVYWKFTPTSSGIWYGYAVHPSIGNLVKITCKDGVYSVQVVEKDLTGDNIKMKATQTGTAQSSVTTTLAVSTTMDNAIATLLNNDATLADGHKVLVTRTYSVDSVTYGQMFEDFNYRIKNTIAGLTEAELRKLRLQVNNTHFQIGIVSGSSTNFYSVSGSATTLIDITVVEMVTGNSNLSKVKFNTNGTVEFENLSQTKIESTNTCKLYI